MTDLEPYAKLLQHAERIEDMAHRVSEALRRGTTNRVRAATLNTLKAEVRPSRLATLQEYIDTGARKAGV